MFKDQFLIEMQDEGLKKLVLFSSTEPITKIREIELPELGSIKDLDVNKDSHELFYNIVSFTDPGRSLRVDMETFK